MSLHKDGFVCRDAPIGANSLVDATNRVIYELIGFQAPRRDHICASAGR